MYHIASKIINGTLYGTIGAVSSFLICNNILYNFGDRRQYWSRVFHPTIMKITLITSIASIYISSIGCNENKCLIPEAIRKQIKN